jgi:hypothetical protein
MTSCAHGMNYRVAALEHQRLSEDEELLAGRAHVSCSSTRVPTGTRVELFPSQKSRARSREVP